MTKFRKSVASVIALCLVMTGVPVSQASAAEEKPSGTVIDVTDFGADPGGKEDSALAIQAAIEAAKEEEGPVTIEFPKGEYHIYPDYSQKRDLYVSNTVGSNQSYVQKTIGILLENMKDVTIEGNDSLFMYHGKMTVFSAIDCENIKFQNFDFDFQVPTVIDVTVEELGNDGTSDYAVAYVPECYNYEIDGANINWMSDQSPYTGKRYWTTRNNMNYTQIYDLASGETKRAGNGLFSGASGIEDLGNNRLKFTYNSRSPQVQPGICYQMRITDRDTPGTLIWQSKDVMLENIGAHFLHGFGMVGQFSENITYENVTFKTPENSGRTTAGYADFIQMSGCKGEVKLNNCFFSNAHDDPINVHGTFLQVVERITDRTFKVRYMHNETAGFPNFYVGDEVEFMTKGNMVPVENSVAKVTEVDGPNDGSRTDIVITLDRDMPEEIGVNTHVVENITYTPSVTVTNNVFQAIPTRGILVTTRKPILIENNYFDSMGMAAIYISNDAAGWYESGPTRDVTIRNNVFNKCGSADGAPTIFFDPTNTTVNPDQPVHQNALIENNTFYMKDQQVLRAKSVSNLKFKNNQIYRYDPQVEIRAEAKSSVLGIGDNSRIQVNGTAASNGTGLYGFSGCKGVELSGNKYDAGLNQRASLSNGMTNDSKYITIDSEEGVTIDSDHRTDPVGTIHFKSSDEAVASVSEEGVVTGVSDGKAVITAYSDIDGRIFESNRLNFYVGNSSGANLPTDISIDSGSDQITDLNTSMNFTAEVVPADADDTSVKWSALDPDTGEESKIAGISEDGVLTAAMEGVVLVKASTVNGRTDAKLIAVSTPSSPELKANWEIKNEDKTKWSMDDTKDAVNITTSMGGLWATSNSVTNLMLTSFDSEKENVTATVKMSGKTKSGWEEAGLIFYQDGNNYTAVQRKHAGGSPNLNFVTETAGSPSEMGGAENVSDTLGDDIFFKIEKSGTKLTGYYSENGTEWVKLREVENTGLGSDYKVGILACGDPGGGAEAAFQFKELQINGQTYGFHNRNTAPAVSQITYTPSTVIAGEKLTAEYRYEDADSDAEGNTAVYWLAGDTKEGSFHPVEGLKGAAVTVPEELEGSYLKAAVIPKDERGKNGSISYGSAVKIHPEAAKSLSLPAAQERGSETEKAASGSAVSHLAAAEISGADFVDFSEKQYTYVTTAEAEMETSNLSFTAADENAGIELLINSEEAGTAVGSIERKSVALLANHNIIEVKVTAPDGVDKSYYRFVIMRKGYDESALSGIQINGKAIQDFDPDKTEYILVEDGEKTLQITADQAHPSSKLAITAGKTRTEGNAAEVRVKAGLNRVYLTVKPDTNGANRYYTLTVKVPKADDSNLEDLHFDSNVKLDQRFEPDRYYYTASVTNGESRLYLTAQDVGAAVKANVNGKEMASDGNELTVPVSFYKGDNEIVVTVTASDGSSRMYAVTVTGEPVAYANDSNWKDYTVGWGTIQIDKSISGNPIQLKDENGTNVTYEKGIGTHATSVIHFEVEGKGYERFRSFVGVDASQGGKGSVTFKVEKDGVEAFNSGELTSASSRKEVDVDLAGVKVLTLIADMGANDGNDHADWADARFTTSGMAERPDQTVYQVTADSKGEGTVTTSARDGKIHPGSSLLITAIPKNAGEIATVQANGNDVLLNDQNQAVLEHISEDVEIHVEFAPKPGEECTCRIDRVTFPNQNVTVGAKEDSRKLTLTAEAVLGGDCRLEGHSSRKLVYTYEKESDTTGTAVLKGDQLTVSNSGIVSVNVTAAVEGTQISSTQTARIIVTKMQEEACTCRIDRVIFPNQNVTVGAKEDSRTLILTAEAVLGGDCRLEGHSSRKAVYTYEKVSDTTGTAVLKGDQLTVSKSGTVSVKVTAAVEGTQISSTQTAQIYVTKQQPAERPAVKPGQVKGVKASANKTTSLKLSWTKVNGADLYKVEQLVKKKWKPVKTVQGTGCSVSGLKTGMIYSYRVTAVNNAGAGKPSGTLKAAAAPKKPSVKVKAVGNRVRVTWPKKKQTADGFEIYMQTGKGRMKRLDRKNVKSGSYTTKKLKKGKTYRFKVRGYKKIGSRYAAYSSYTKTWRIKIK